MSSIPKSSQLVLAAHKCLLSTSSSASDESQEVPPKLKGGAQTLPASAPSGEKLETTARSAASKLPTVCLQSPKNWDRYVSVLIPVSVDTEIEAKTASKNTEAEIEACETASKTSPIIDVDAEICRKKI